MLCLPTATRLLCPTGRLRGRACFQDAGLTLFEIASIMTRPFEGGGEELSDLEKFASYARTAVEVSCL